MTELLFETISTPIGSIDLVARPDCLVNVDFSDCRDRLFHLLEKRWGRVSLTPQSTPFSQSLRDYFAGELNAIADVPVLLKGTPFQNRVWSQLSQIPVGQTLTYGELAKQINQPRAAQAVGRANSQNPILIFLPCHRVIGKNQQMVGYSAGIERKKWLLHHEQAHL